jgi:hypothetical protein
MFFEDDDRMLLAPEMNDVSLLDEIGLADLQLSWPPSPETFSPLQLAISAPFHDHHHNDQFATTAGGDNFAFFQSDDVMQDIPTVSFGYLNFKLVHVVFRWPNWTKFFEPPPPCPTSSRRVQKRNRHSGHTSFTTNLLKGLTFLSSNAFSI